MGQKSRPTKGSVKEFWLYHGTEKKKEKSQTQVCDDCGKQLEREVERPTKPGVTTEAELEGAKVGIRYIGPGKVERWELVQNRLHKQHVLALSKVRSQTDRLNAPELWQPDFILEDYQRGFSGMCVEVFSFCIEWVEFDGERITDMNHDNSGARDYVEYLTRLSAWEKKREAFDEALLEGKVAADPGEEPEVPEMHEVMEWLLGLGLADRIRLRQACIDAQRLKRRQLFRAPSFGDVPAGGHHEAADGLPEGPQARLPVGQEGGLQPAHG